MKILVIVILIFSTFSVSAESKFLAFEGVETMEVTEDELKKIDEELTEQEKNLMNAPPTFYVNNAVRRMQMQMQMERQIHLQMLKK